MIPSIDLDLQEFMMNLPLKIYIYINFFCTQRKIPRLRQSIVSKSWLTRGWYFNEKINFYSSSGNNQWKELGILILLIMVTSHNSRGAKRLIISPSLFDKAVAL